MTEGPNAYTALLALAILVGIVLITRFNAVYNRRYRHQ